MKKLWFGVLTTLAITISALTYDTQVQTINRIDPAVKLYTPLDTMLGSGQTGRGCAITYKLIYGLADTVIATITIPNDTTSYCTYFAVRHPQWVKSFIN